MLNLVSYPLNSIIPEFASTCRDFGLKYFPFLPIEIYFRLLKNLLIRLLRKFKGRKVSACLFDFKADRSTSLTALIVRLYVSLFKLASSLIKLYFVLVLGDWHPNMVLPQTK